MRPIAKRALIVRVRNLARRVAEHDERGELGSFGLAWLKDSRRQALRAGCLAEDVDEATMSGLVEGRGAGE